VGHNFHFFQSLPKVFTDTIERNILDLAARKGLSLYTKENSSGSLNVSSFSKDNETAIDDPGKRKALQKGDFIHKVDDMLAILFPHMFEEIEYLVPPTDIADRDLDVEMTETNVPRRVLTGIEINAIAGPSRVQ
jgi:E3 ubiquitin-protein ligase SHPRH